eukprot:scaffold91862_cov51-Cyclotella_meneghiniana.AAC.2
MQVLRQELSSSKNVNLKPSKFRVFLQLQIEPQLSTSASHYNPPLSTLLVAGAKRGDYTTVDCDCHDD